MTIENKFLLAAKKKIRDHVPGLLPLAGRAYAATFGYRNERAYLKGRLQLQTDRPSLVLLSCNRAATQFTEDILARIYERGGGRHIALNRYLFFSDRDAGRHMLDHEHMAGLMQPRGFFFGQQGPFREHSFLDDFTVVTMVRDPRDLLVSHFYSVTEAHVPRNKEFIERIGKAREMGLQRYVLDEEVVEYYESCLEQSRSLLGRERVLTWRYEDMMDDFRSFHEACQDHILGERDPELSSELESLFKGPVAADDERAGRHRRSGRWGQFREVLEPDVIGRLNERFAPLLKEFDYELSEPESAPS